MSEAESMLFVDLIAGSYLWAGVIIGKTLPLIFLPGFSHLKIFKIKPSPGFLKSIF